MHCAWKELMMLLPPWLREAVNQHGQVTLQELRLRINAPPELVLNGGNRWLHRKVSAEDISFCINTASRYSPWAAATISRGYLTAPGGHRIGLCGDAVMKDGNMTGIRNISSLCIRVARDFPGIGEKLKTVSGSVLILGAPGWGKTTLLRDLIRQRSDSGCQVSVVDERGELFPNGFLRGKCTEVLTGCPKDIGMDLLLRAMGPDTIAVDEITAEADCLGLSRAAWCGVNLLATAHAASLEDYLSRSVYIPLVQQRIFDTIVILHRDKSWHLERSKRWTTNGSVQY